MRNRQAIGRQKEERARLCCPQAVAHTLAFVPLHGRAVQRTPTASGSGRGTPSLQSPPLGGQRHTSGQINAACNDSASPGALPPGGSAFCATAGLGVSTALPGAPTRPSPGRPSPGRPFPGRRAPHGTPFPGPFPGRRAPRAPPWGDRSRSGPAALPAPPRAAALTPRPAPGKGRDARGREASPSPATAPRAAALASHHCPGSASPERRRAPTSDAAARHGGRWAAPPLPGVPRGGRAVPARWPARRHGPAAARRALPLRRGRHPHRAAPGESRAGTPRAGRRQRRAPAVSPGGTGSAVYCRFNSPRGAADGHLGVSGPSRGARWANSLRRLRGKKKNSPFFLQICRALLVFSNDREIVCWSAGENGDKSNGVISHPENRPGDGRLPAGAAPEGDGRSSGRFRLWEDQGAARRWRWGQRRVQPPAPGCAQGRVKV